MEKVVRLPKISAEQIVANIMASQARQARGKEKNRIKNEEQRAQRAAEEKAHYEANPYPHLNGKTIGFVVKTRKGRFLPLIGTPYASPGDNDSFIRVTGKQEQQDTLEAALAFYQPDLDKFAKVYDQPTRPEGMMLHWVSAIEADQERLF